MANEQVAIALHRFERATSEALGALAAAKAEPIKHDELTSAIARVLGPLKECFGLLQPLPSAAQARIAGCADACSDVVERCRRTDNLGGQRLHRQPFAANVDEVADQASWILDALRSWAALQRRDD